MPLNAQKEAQGGGFYGLNKPFGVVGACEQSFAKFLYCLMVHRIYRNRIAPENFMQLRVRRGGNLMGGDVIAADLTMRRRKNGNIFLEPVRYGVRSVTRRNLRSSSCWVMFGIVGARIANKSARRGRL